VTTPRAEIRIEGPEAEILRRALAPEAGRDIPKTAVRIAGRGRSLVLRIEAEDTSALRAALNSYLRWADVASSVVREVRT